MTRIQRPRKVARTVYLTDDDYTAAVKASIEARQNFSDYAGQALRERIAKQIMDKAAAAVRDKLKPVYVSPTGTLQWRKDYPCWCGLCHDPWGVNPHAMPGATTESDWETYSGVAEGSKPFHGKRCES